MKLFKVLAVAVFTVTAFSWAASLRAVKTQGTVKIMINGQAKNLTVNTPIPQSAEIKTGPQAYVELRTANGSVLKLGPRSTFSASEYAGQNGSTADKFNLEGGTLYSKIAKLQPNQQMEFFVAETVAGVRGTEFALSKIGDEAKLLVEEGSVGFKNAFGEQILGAGQIASALKGQAPTPPAPFTPEQLQALVQGIPETDSFGVPDSELPAVEESSEATEGSGAVENESTESSATAANTSEENESSEGSAEGEEESEESGEGEESGSRPSVGSFSIDSVAVNGETWTRISFMPELPIGKLAMAFDIQVWLDNQGKFSSKGWDFGKDAWFDSLMSKIYYLRWSQKNNVLYGEDKLFFKVGNLDNVNMGRGILVKNYNNTAFYPYNKKLGVEFAFGNFSEESKSGMEGFVADVKDVANGGAVIGARYFVKPTDKLQWGLSYAGDINQYAGLFDADGDGIPNEIDPEPYNAKNDNTPDVDGDGIQDIDYLKDQDWFTTGVSNTMVSEGNVDTNITAFDLDDVTDAYHTTAFDIIWGGANFQIYAQAAAAFDPEQDDDLSASSGIAGYGLTAPGLYIKTPKGFFDLNLEYRYIQDKFRLGYFDSYYDLQRVVYNGTGGYNTKDSQLVDVNYNGIYGSAGLYLWLIRIGGVYEFLKGEEVDSHRLEFSGSIVKEKLEAIPALSKYITDAQAYYVNYGFSELDQAFDDGINKVYGAKAAISLGGSSSLVYDYQVYYSYDGNGELQEEIINKVGTATQF